MMLSLVSSSMPGHFMQDRSTCKAVQHGCLQAHDLHLVHSGWLVDISQRKVESTRR